MPYLNIFDYLCTVKNNVDKFVLLATTEKNAKTRTFVCIFDLPIVARTPLNFSLRIVCKLNENYL